MSQNITKDTSRHFYCLAISVLEGAYCTIESASVCVHSCHSSDIRTLSVHQPVSCPHFLDQIVHTQATFPDVYSQQTPVQKILVMSLLVGRLCPNHDRHEFKL